MNIQNKFQSTEATTLSSQTRKKSFETTNFQKEKKILEQSNHIPLYLSNSSFQFDSLDHDNENGQNHTNQKNQENQKQKQIYHASKTEKQNQDFEFKNHQASLNLQIDSQQKMELQALQHFSSSFETDNQNNILCQNRKYFTQTKQDSNGFISNKLERVNYPMKSQENIFCNPQCSVKQEEKEVSLRQLQQNIEKQNHFNSTSIQERNITNKTENRQQTYVSTSTENDYENEDDFNQEFYMKNIIQINNEEQLNDMNNHNNICDITTITNSVQANNEEYNFINNTSRQNKKIPPAIFESSDNILEVDYSKKQKIKENNFFNRKEEKSEKNDLKQKSNLIEPKSNLSKIIQDKEQELIDLRERKRKIEEEEKSQQSISYEEHSKQIKQLKSDVDEKEQIIKQLKEQIKNFQAVNVNERESQNASLTQELKERDQIIFNLQKELKDKLCDQENYKDKIKFYHEQSVKQQTNDILVCQLNSTVKQQQYQIDKFDIIQKQKEDIILDLETQLTSIKHQFKTAKEDLSKYRNQNEDYQLKLKDLERDNQLFQKQLTELRANCDQLQTENNQLKEKYIKKMQQINTSQEQKVLNQLEMKIGSSFTYQFTDKNYTLGNDQNQLKINNIDKNTNEMTQDQLKNQGEMNRKQSFQVEQRRNSLNKNLDILQDTDDQQYEQKYKKCQLNVSDLNLSMSEQNDKAQLSPQYQQADIDYRSKEQNSFKETGIQQFLNSSQLNLCNFRSTLNLKENSNPQAGNEVQLNNPRQYRSNSSYDGFTRAQSSQANYNSNNQYQWNNTNQFQQSQVSYQPYMSYQQQFINQQPQVFNNAFNDSNFNSNLKQNHQEIENKQILQESNKINQQNYHQTQDNFGRKNNNNNNAYHMNKTQINLQNKYAPPPKYNSKLNINKENSYQMLNQTYDYITNVRSSSPLNTSFNNITNTPNHQLPTENKNQYNIMMGKLRYSLPRTATTSKNSQLPQPIYPKQFK